MIAKLLCITCIALFFQPLVAGDKVEKMGGKSISETFLDERVAKLIEAVINGDYQEADAQLKTGADINYIGVNSIVPLAWVLVDARQNDNLMALDYMLKNGADPNYQDLEKGVSLMEVVTGGDSTSILEIMLKFGANPNLIVPDKSNLLQVAVFHRRIEHVDILLKYGADINSKTFWGTLANTAVALGEFEWVAGFLERGLNQHLENLASSAKKRKVPSNSDAQRWKNKVLEVLKEKIK